MYFFFCIFFGFFHIYLFCITIALWILHIYHVVLYKMYIQLVHWERMPQLNVNYMRWHLLMSCDFFFQMSIVI